MSETFASSLTSDGGRELRLAIVIQGIPIVFQEDREDVPDAVVALAGYGDGSDHARFKGVEKIEQAAKALDMVQRRMTGGALSFSVIDDDDDTLLTLIAPRRRRAAFLIDNFAVGDGGLDVNSTDPFDAGGGVVYVGAETMTYSGHDGVDLLTGVIAGAFGSEQQAHFGGPEQGAGACLLPPMWIGRRVKLLGYFERADGTTTADLARVLDTFRLEAPPKSKGDGCWSFQCSHLSDEFARRKLGTGLVDLEVLPETVTLQSDNLRIRTPAALSPLLLTQGSLPSFALVTSDGGSEVLFDNGLGQRAVRNTDAGTGIFEVTTTNSDYFEVKPENRVIGGTAPVNPKTVRHIAILDSGNPGVDVLIALASRLGDGDNGDYDQLGGKKRLNFGFDGFQLGAGIAAGELDVAAFEAVGALARPGISFVIDGAIDVKDFLFDFCLATDSFWYVKRNGQLSVRLLGEERLASTVTVNDDVIIGEPEVTYDEESIYPRLTLESNYDPVSRAFEYTNNIVDDEMLDLYPVGSIERPLTVEASEDPLTVKSRAIVVEGGAVGGGTLRRPTMSFEDVRLALRRLQRGGARGAAFVDAVCHIDLFIADLGDVVLLTVDVPDLEGAFVSGRTARVVSIEPDYDEAQVSVRFEILETLFFVAPACLVASRTGDTLTLATTGPENSSGANPADMFGVGWSVMYFDIDTQSSEFFTVVSAVGDQLELDGTPTFANAVGDFVTVVGQDDITGEAASENDLHPRDFLYMQEDDPIDGNPITRWR